MKNVTTGRVVSAAVEVNNSGDEARQYGITAMADTSEGRVINVHQGIVTDLETNGHLADFNSQGCAESMSVTYQTSKGRGAILEAVEEFITTVCGTTFNLTAE